MSSTRQLKYAGLIQKDLSQIFQQNTKHWFPKAFITVTAVEVSADLRLAKVFISLMNVADQSGFLELIKSKKSEMRNALGLRIGKQARVVPDLAFYLDEVGTQAQKMEDLLTQLNIPPQEEVN